MGKPAEHRGSGERPDPVRSFNRWKKKRSHRQNQKQQLRKPEWQVEREGISRLIQNHEKGASQPIWTPERRVRLLAQSPAETTINSPTTESE